MAVAYSVKTNSLSLLSHFLYAICVCLWFIVAFLGRVCVSQLEWRLFILLVMKEGPPGASVMGWEASDFL